MGGYGPPGKTTGGGYCVVWFLCLLMLPLLTLSGCATPVVTAAPNDCSSLIPSSWRAGVPGAPLPDGDQVADWLIFGEAQTGKLETANGRTVDTIELIARCEKRDAAAVQRATRRRFLGIPL